MEESDSITAPVILSLHLFEDCITEGLEGDEEEEEKGVEKGVENETF